MPEPALPKLTFQYGSSAKAISQVQISNDLPTIMTYDEPITIRALPGTNLWRKPPSTDIDNAPTFLVPTPINIHKFSSARVTISANWSTSHDQGGLVLYIPDQDAVKWIKTGIECEGGQPWVGTVATRRWSDWSSVPLGREESSKVTIQVEREVEEGEKVESLWVYIIDEETGEKMGIRQINWWFRHDILDKKVTTDSEKNRCLFIGVYAARPRVPEGEGKENEELVVKFEGFEVKLFDD
jgi:uncharacterized protein